MMKNNVIFNVVPLVTNLLLSR